MVSGTKCSSNGVTACLTTKAVHGDLGILFHLASGSRPRQCLRAFRERTDLDFRKVGLDQAIKTGHLDEGINIATRGQPVLRRHPVGNTLRRSAETGRAPSLLVRFMRSIVN